jgi:hypothetical protein
VDEEIVLLHGCLKQQQKTPRDDLALAKKGKKQYSQNSNLPPRFQENVLAPNSSPHT